jgi:hypothetical protein
MGVSPDINADTYPKQGYYMGWKVDVCYNYDPSRKTEGVVIRDDAVAPHLTIIQTVDGRVLLATECQFSPIEPGVAT